MPSIKIKFSKSDQVEQAGLGNILLANICNYKKYRYISVLLFFFLFISYSSFATMSASRITMSRRRFVEELQKSSRVTFSDLRKSLVTSEHMNLATLYRIVDAFSAQWLIHEMTIAWERVIFPCQCENPSENDGVTVSFCENCGAIYDVHTKLVSPYISSMSYARMKSCNACVIG